MKFTSTAQNPIEYDYGRQSVAVGYFNNDTRLVVGDFNYDTKLDFAVANKGSDSFANFLTDLLILYILTRIFFFSSLFY
jgi:hypothetical protein